MVDRINYKTRDCFYRVSSRRVASIKSGDRPTAFSARPSLFAGDRYHDEWITRVTLVNGNARKLGETDRSPMETMYDGNVYLPCDKHTWERRVMDNRYILLIELEKYKVISLLKCNVRVMYFEQPSRASRASRRRTRTSKRCSKKSSKGNPSFFRVLLDFSRTSFGFSYCLEFFASGRMESNDRSIAGRKELYFRDLVAFLHLAFYITNFEMKWNLRSRSTRSLRIDRSFASRSAITDRLWRVFRISCWIFLVLVLLSDANFRC